MPDASSLPAMPSQCSELVTAETDYRQITDALMQTQRGRQFLAEHARRCRQSQQAELLAALVRLERVIAIDRESPGMKNLRSDLASLTHAVESVRTEVAALRPAASPNRLRAKDEEMLRLLREQSTRLDALADIWTHAQRPASLTPENAAQPAVEIGQSLHGSGHAQEPREQAAVPAQNSFVDGPVGEPYRTETPASDLLKQTPIFDLAFNAKTATEPTAGAIAASEAAAEAAEHAWSDRLAEPAAPFAIVRDRSEQDHEQNGKPSEHRPATSELVCLTETDRLRTTETACDCAETALAEEDDLAEPEQQLHAKEVSSPNTPEASIVAEPLSASLTAGSSPVSGADEASSGSTVASHSSAVGAVGAAAGDPLAPLYALSEEERIALFT